MLEIVTQAKAARLVGVTPMAVKYWIDNGFLPAQKVDGTVMIRVSDLEEANKKSLLNFTRRRLLKAPV